MRGGEGRGAEGRGGEGRGGEGSSWREGSGSGRKAGGAQVEGKTGWLEQVQLLTMYIFRFISSKWCGVAV